jgi:hypothetical protein
MSVYVNCAVEDAGQWVADIIAGFGFDTDFGGGHTVGYRAGCVVGQGIHDRSLEGRGPDGDWDRNAPSTIARKGRDQPNFDTGEMLDPKNIAGTVTSTREECRIEYSQDAELRKKAELAHTGQSHKKIIRRFMGLDETISDEVRRSVADDLVAWIERHGEGSWG